jgi:hypothetical protein
MTSNDSDALDKKKKNTSKWQQIPKIFKFIHVPFQPDDKKLKLQVSDNY